MVPLDLSGACFDVGGSAITCRRLVVSGLGFHLNHSYSTGLSTEVASRFTLNRKRGGIGKSVCLCVCVGGGCELHTKTCIKVIFISRLIFYSYVY